MVGLRYFRRIGLSLGGWVKQRNERLPAGAQHGDQRGRRDQQRLPLRAPRPAFRVARRRPSQQLRAEHEVRRVRLEDEGAVGKLVEWRLVAQLPACVRSNALGLELRVDRVGTDLTWVEVLPDRDEPRVVVAAAERTRAMAGGESSRLVEEEQLREAARLQQRAPLPAAELEAAGDPALAAVAPADTPGLVVEAAAIAVDQAARGIGRASCRERVLTDV